MKIHIAVLALFLGFGTGTCLGTEPQKESRGNRLSKAGTMTRETSLLVKEFKNSLAEQLSPDGNLLLLFHTDKPTRIFGTIPLDGSPPIVPPHEHHDDYLQLVELATGRELRRVPVEFFPDDVQFLPASPQVFYTELQERRKECFRFWNATDGSVRTVGCEEKPVWKHIVVLHDDVAIGAFGAENKPWGVLAKLDLRTGARQRLDYFDPLHPNQGRMGEGFALSPGKKHLAYRFLGSHSSIIVRRTDTMQIENRIPLPAPKIRDEVFYSPDGKYLLAFADVGERLTFYLYDTSTYDLTKQLTLALPKPKSSLFSRGSLSFVASAVAISPDAGMIAIGWTRDERQAMVSLFDFETGEELAEVSHPAISPQRKDPFAAKLEKILFSPDSNYLISGSRDTRIWKLSKGSAK